jgi:RNA polymerase sigma-70 factor (ECF subfamily)
MSQSDWLAERFESHRRHLEAVAYRMLGSRVEADDAVQEAWLRLSRSDTAAIENLGGWLTTVVARVSLDMLRARRARHEDQMTRPEQLLAVPTADDPEEDAVVADSVGAALVIVLDALTPTERLAFVLHDLFAVPFEEIATIVGRSPGATKMLTSRARAKVRGSGPVADTDPARRRAIIDAFLAASRGGDFDALVALLHPDVVLEADAAAIRMGSPATVNGAAAVAGTFAGRAQAARPALIDGAVGIAWAVGGQTKVAWDFSIVDAKIVHIDMLASPELLAELGVTMLRR